MGVSKTKDSVTGPLHLALDITNKCNYRCLHCYNASGENCVVDNELTDEEVLELINQISKIKPHTFCFCGGEPLLRKDLIVNCAEILYRNGVSAISAVSNGYYLTEEIADELVQAHVSGIQISLDGFSKNSCFELRQNVDAFSRAVRAIKILSKYRDKISIGVAFCPTKFNTGEFEAVYNFCKANGVRQLRVQPLMIIGRASKHVEEIKPSDEQYVQLIRKIYELNKSSIQVVSNEKKHVLYKNPICIEWGDPLDHIFRYREGNDSCYTTMSIKANGDIAPSPYLPLSIGNIRCHTLQEYWDSGYPKIWKLPILKKMASTLNTVDDMQCDSMGYNTWIDRDYSCDIIDEHLME